jgi:nitroimidazol reductase NimA-like FMN-containing flavoprotein (pyridoxamine 5'-phosphate oxidase superfamily)
VSAAREPRASRPAIDYGLDGPDAGQGLLPFARAREALERATVYWLTTSGRDGAPHSVPVWGLWQGDVFYLSMGERTVGGRNLAADPRVRLHLESGEDVVIVDGRAAPVQDAGLAAELERRYAAKYDWDEPVGSFLAITPTRAFAWLCRGVGAASARDFTGSATRYVW